MSELIPKNYESVNSENHEFRKKILFFWTRYCPRTLPLNTKSGMIKIISLEIMTLCHHQHSRIVTNFRYQVGNTNIVSPGHFRSFFLYFGNKSVINHCWPIGSWNDPDKRDLGKFTFSPGYGKLADWDVTNNGHSSKSK